MTTRRELTEAVGWRISSSMTSDFVLDALEQALHSRQPGDEGTLIRHSDRGSQGGFNRSLQHLQKEVSNGTTTGLGSEQTEDQ